MDYDPSGTGLLVSLTDPETNARTYQYDALGRLTEVLEPGGGVLTYTYGGSLVFQEAWDNSGSGNPSGSVERVYDSHRRVLGQTVNDADLVSWSYDADGFLRVAGALTLSRDPQHGLPTATTLGEVSDSYSYNGFGEVTGYSADYDGADLLDVTYERDKAGRIKRKTETIGGTTLDTWYEYDAAGRLHQVCDDDDCSTVRAEYTYDANSNRTGGFDQVSGVISATYDTQDLELFRGRTNASTRNSLQVLKFELDLRR
jgi:YD repeat-containing protein